jgi:hypothetical protein
MTAVMRRLAAPALALVLVAGAVPAHADGFTGEATPFPDGPHAPPPEIGGKCVRDLARNYGGWSHATLIRMAAQLCEMDPALVSIIVDDAQHRR